MNKFLNKDSYAILNELDLSHSGELVFENNVWSIDGMPIQPYGFEDLYLLRLIRLSYSDKNEQIWKLTSDGKNCLNDSTYTPKIAEVPSY